MNNTSKQTVHCFPIITKHSKECKSTSKLLNVNSYPTLGFPALDFPLQHKNIPDCCVQCTIAMLN